MKPNKDGIAIILVVVLLTTIVTCGLTFMQLVHSGINQTSSRILELQAQYLADTAAKEGLWYIRNIDSGFIGESSHHKLEQGEYWFEVISSRSVIGSGSVSKVGIKPVVRVVSLNSYVLPLAYPVTRNLEGLNYALWLGPGTDFAWGPTLSVRGGSVHSCSRNIVFHGGGNKIIDRYVRVSGEGYSINESNWLSGAPSSGNLSNMATVIMNYDFTELSSLAAPESPPSEGYFGTSRNPISLPKLVFANSDLSIGGVYSGNIAIVVGNTRVLTITENLIPLRARDSIAIIAGSSIVISDSVTLIKASVFANDFVSVQGPPRNVNIFGNIAINGQVDQPLMLADGVTLNIDYDPRLFSPVFGNQIAIPNPLTMFWYIR